MNSTNLQAEADLLNSKISFMTKLGFELEKIEVLPMTGISPDVIIRQISYISKNTCRKVCFNLNHENIYSLSVVIYNIDSDAKLKPQLGHEEFTDHLLIGDWGKKHQIDGTRIDFYTQQGTESFDGFVERSAKRLEKLFNGPLKDILSGHTWENIPFDYYRLAYEVQTRELFGDKKKN